MLCIKYKIKDKSKKINEWGTNCSKEKDKTNKISFRLKFNLVAWQRRHWKEKWRPKQIKSNWNWVFFFFFFLLSKQLSSSINADMLYSFFFFWLFNGGVLFSDDNKFVLLSREKKKIELIFSSIWLIILSTFVFIFFNQAMFRVNAWTKTVHGLDWVHG